MAVSAETELAQVAASPRKNVTRLIVATSLGNALEWFDISVYAYFAVYISKAFFPTNDQTTSLLSVEPVMAPASGLTIDLPHIDETGSAGIGLVATSACWERPLMRRRCCRPRF
jgi:hypothetical protein